MLGRGAKQALGANAQSPLMTTLLPLQTLMHGMTMMVLLLTWKKRHHLLRARLGTTSQLKTPLSSLSHHELLLTMVPVGIRLLKTSIMLAHTTLGRRLQVTSLPHHALAYTCPHPHLPPDLL